MIIQAIGGAFFPNSKLIFGDEISIEFNAFFEVKTLNKAIAEQTVLNFLNKNVRLDEGFELSIFYYKDREIICEGRDPKELMLLRYQNLIKIADDDLVENAEPELEGMYWECWKCKKTLICDLDENNFNYYKCKNCGYEWHQLN